jgi:hypothetical protein
MLPWFAVRAEGRKSGVRQLRRGDGSLGQSRGPADTGKDRHIIDINRP